MLRVINELQSQYPKDDFVIVSRPRPTNQPEAESEWRMKCKDWFVVSLFWAMLFSSLTIAMQSRADLSAWTRRVAAEF